MKSSVGGFFSSTIPEIWNTYIKPWFTVEKWNELMGNIETAIHNFITGIPDKIVSAGESVISGIGSLWNSITSFLGGL